MKGSFKDLGAVYTPEDTPIIAFLCNKTIYSYILDRLNQHFGTKYHYRDSFSVFQEIQKEYLKFLEHVVKDIKILDPAVGSGHFLLEVVKTLEKIYHYLVEEDIREREDYEIHEWIICNNLFGVDISVEAVEKCKTRLISILSSLQNDFDFSQVSSKLNTHIRHGNALTGTLNDIKSRLVVTLLDFHWRFEFPEIMSESGFDIVIGNPPWNILKPLEKEFFSQYDPRLSKYNVDKQEAKQIIQGLLKNNDISQRWQEYNKSIRTQADYFRNGEYRYQSDQMKVAGTQKTVSGDLNLYKIFLERSYQLTKPEGYCGFIIPSGIHIDAGTKGLRRLLFDESEVKDLYCFENREAIFPSIHKSFKFDLLVFKKKGTTETFRAAFMLSNPEILHTISEKALSIKWDLIKRFSPSSWSILEFKTKKDIELVSKMYQHPTLGSSIQDSWTVRFRRELDISLDSSLFNTLKDGLTVYEGKMIEQYTHLFKEPRYWITPSNITLKYGKNYQEFKEFRLGFRAVAASTNRRTMIATIIPPMVCCGNSLIITKIFDEKNSRLLRVSDILYLAGVFNSFVFDYLLRLKISQNLNMFFIYDMPVPKISRSHKVYQEIIKNVAALIPESPEFDSLLNQLNLEKSMLTNLNRIQKSAKVDILVTKLYGFDKESLEYILDQFHQKDGKKEKQLNFQKSIILDRFE
ncbi:MAG: Eco57I restriction-modification methylase domain-containing protein [Candidatus Hodarchaeota archaeon]